MRVSSLLTDPGPRPPARHVSPVRFELLTVMEQRTHSTEELGGYEVPLLPPGEVFIVESIILVEDV